MMTDKLLPCPFCGSQAEILTAKSMRGGKLYGVMCNCCAGRTDVFDSEDGAIDSWNSRAPMEFDNWFYLPKPKETIVEVTETTHTWDGMNVKTDVFYQVRKQAAANWAKELDEHIIRRICDVWNKERIVRCADCREYNPELYRHITCELLGRYVEPDGFCAWAERKEVAE